MASVLNEAYFHDEASAFTALEGIMWPNGTPPHCPHCGVTDRMNRLAVQKSKPSKKHPKGKPVHGLWKCYACRKQFTVRKGTVFEASHLELHQWFQAAFLICSSKKGVSSNQLHRTLRCTLKTAWFASMRLREAMRAGDLAVPFGTTGSDVEADETFFGRDPDARPTPKHANPSWVEKMKVLTLVDRASGRARSFVVDDLSKATIAPILRENIAKEARLLTDEAPRYITHGRMFADHQSVNHSRDEYVRMADRTVHTNTVEGFFSIFKRGMRGTYQHCAKRHLHRYLAEFDFRYNNRVACGVNDSARTIRALKGAKGKRLMYMDSLAGRA